MLRFWRKNNSKMPTDIFKKRKKDILGKKDKSCIGGWDKKIVGLCNKLNKSENYYSTSSCSGRVVLIYDSDKKTHGLFLKVYHGLVNFEDFKKDLKEIAKKTKRLVNFKQEPCGLHVACRSLENAQNLLDKAKKIGWKKSGIISSDKRFIIEMFGTGKLEFPIIYNGKILVNEEFLKLVVKRANRNLKRSWKQIKDLGKEA